MPLSLAAVRESFSLRENARHILVAPNKDAHLRPLDGLRALSVLWVLLFHAGWYAFIALPLPRYVELLHEPWMLPLWRGDFGVDVFFVLSGFLIGGILHDERRASKTVRVGRFLARRLMRLWPTLVVATLLDVVVLGEPPGRAWANLLYVSNLLPILNVNMGWTWSLSIEEQFYLVAPWLFRASAARRLLVLALLLLAFVAVAGAVVHLRGFHVADSEIVLTRPLEFWAPAYDALYSKPWMRVGPLVAGVIAADLYRRPRVMSALAKTGAAGGGVFLVALVLAALATHWPLAFGSPRPLEILFLASYRTVFGLSTAFVLLFSLSSHPLGRRIGRALSSRLLFPFAQLAYAAYLLNPIVAMKVHPMLAARAAAAPSPMVWFIPADLALTFAAAFVVSMAIERPFMNLRRHLRFTR